MARRSRRSSGGRSSSMGGSRGGGGAGEKIVWFLVIGGLIFAFYQVPYDPGAKGLFDIAKSKAATVQAWATGVEPKLGEFADGIIKGGSEVVNPGPAEGTDYEEYDENGVGKPAGGGGGYVDYNNMDTSSGPSTSNTGIASNNALILLPSLPVAKAEKVAYERDEWKHWSLIRPCWNVRDEILVRDATPGTIKLEDKNGKVTTDLAAACKVTGGEWVDAYTNDKITDPKKIDIDHMVPLKYTATHGGQAWDKDRKEAYANSLDGTHLIAVSAGANRSKSDKGPGKWMPTNKAYHCSYAESWVAVTSTWGLTLNPEDVAQLEKTLKTCN